MTAVTTDSTSSELHIQMGPPTVVTMESNTRNVCIQMGTPTVATTDSTSSEIHIDTSSLNTVTTESTIPEVHNQMRRTDSAHFKRPDLFLLEETSRKKYLDVGVPLHKLALKGNWKDAKSIIQKDVTLVRTAITSGWATPLHVATGANRFHFVEQLVKFMNKDDLELQDHNGDTAFFLAAGVGNTQLAKIMIGKNPSLPTIRGHSGFSPLHFAVMQEKSEMTRFLYHETTITQYFEEERDWIMLFLMCINVNMYDLALDMLEKRKSLALARDGNKDTGLHILARKHLSKSYTKQTQVLQLVSRLWKIILTTVDELEMYDIIQNPSPLLFDAALIGNFEFLAELISAYPQLIWEKNRDKHTIIHFAVLHRHARIFNLIHEVGSAKDFIVTLIDDDKNNLLHLAAKLAPPDQLNLVSGAAFQLMLELIWFEEVRKIMLPLDREVINSQGQTPSELFTLEHEELLKQAECWMKGTANYCMLVSTVIATGVFSAQFSLPGGIDDNTGTPIDFKTPAFLVFSLSDATALIMSATSTLIFLSILISRYAEYDFYKSLPLKLIFGLISLFISITSMMGAFSSALFITYYHGIKWVPGFVCGLAFLLIPLFGFLQFRLWYDILFSTYYCKYLFRPNKAYALLER